jgi:hypothetical protein
LKTLLTKFFGVDMLFFRTRSSDTIKIGIQNAASVAGLMITTEALISEKPEKKSKRPAMPEMSGDMY